MIEQQLTAEERNDLYQAYLVQFRHNCRAIGIEPVIVTKPMRKGLYKVLRQAGYPTPDDMKEAAELLTGLGRD